MTPQEMKEHYEQMLVKVTMQKNALEKFYPKFLQIQSEALAFENDGHFNEGIRKHREAFEVMNDCLDYLENEPTTCTCNLFGVSRKYLLQIAIDAKLGDEAFGIQQAIINDMPIVSRIIRYAKPPNELPRSGEDDIELTNDDID